MIAENSLRRLADYVLLNACSVHSTGLDNGKAGLSLCLFEVANRLNDKYLEEQAAEILQESLLSKNNDISFKNGLSGIGFSLLYLMKNGFVDADFQEFFGDHTDKILSELQVRINTYQDPELLYRLKIVFFLEELSGQMPERKIASLIGSFAGKASAALECYLMDMAAFSPTVPVMYLSDELEKYFEAAVLCPDFSFSSVLVDRYCRLFRQGRFTGSLTIGYYLSVLSERYTEPEWRKTAEANRQSFLKNLCVDIYPLARRIDFLFLLARSGNGYAGSIGRLSAGLSEGTEEELEKNIVSCIPGTDFIAGYGQGVARYLLYQVYDSCRREKEDVSRFDYLFL